jgi:hypothetical protein
MSKKNQKGWDELEKAANTGPLSLGFKLIILTFILIIFTGGLAYMTGWLSEAASVAREEYGPRAMLEKYEWFKDAAAQLDKKRADTQIYEARLIALEQSYEGESRRDWARSDLEQFNLWQSEVAGVKASYNSLAAEYNSQMAKFNYRFANAGDLPRGASEPLPREFKAYLEN